LALELGATHVIDPPQRPISRPPFALSAEGVDYAFDTTGIPGSRCDHGVSGSEGRVRLVGVCPDAGSGTC